MRYGGLSRAHARRWKKGRTATRVCSTTHGTGGRTAASRTEARMQRGRRKREFSQRCAGSLLRRGWTRGGRRRTGTAAIVPAARRPESERTRASASMRATPCRFFARGRRGRRGEEVCVLSWLRGSSGRRRCDGEAAACARLPQARVRVFTGRARAGGGERVREKPGVVGVLFDHQGCRWRDGRQSGMAPVPFPAL